MAYHVQYCSPLRLEWGSSYFDLFLQDDASIMPDIHVTKKFYKRTSITLAEIQAVVAQEINFYAAAWNSSLIEKATMENAQRVILSDTIDDRCQQLEDTIKSHFPNNPRIQSGLKISWRID